MLINDDVIGEAKWDLSTLHFFAVAREQKGSDTPKISKASLCVCISSYKYRDCSWRLH